MSQIYKTGVVTSGCFTESLNNIYDTTLYIEPDSSVWIRIVHHNNPASVRFASTNDFTKPLYIDADRWFNVAIVSQIINNIYEFMVKSKTTSDATENKYRWIQTINPYDAVYEDVDADDITKITTTGYSSFSWGGIYKFNSSSYMIANNGTKGNWWGAIGAWNSHQGGIPGWTNVITTGYEDLYLRVDNQRSLNTSFFDTHIQSYDFIEY